MCDRDDRPAPCTVRDTVQAVAMIAGAVAFPFVAYVMDRAWIAFARRVMPGSQ